MATAALEPAGPRGFLDGCDLWGSWGPWHHGRGIVRSCGNAPWRPVFQLHAETGSVRGSVARAGRQLSMNTGALRYWARKAEVDCGQPPGTTSDREQRVADPAR